MSSETNMKQLLEKLSSPADREQFLATYLRESIAGQVKAMRAARKLSQARLAVAVGLDKKEIARIEDTECLSWPSMSTLRKLAAYFDCALIVRFVSWTDLLATEFNILTGELKTFEVPVTFAEEFAAELATKQE